MGYDPSIRKGICRLCGKLKELSFEHVPPRAARNAAAVYHPDMRAFLLHRVGRGPQPPVVEEPKGAGGYTLCGPCNNRCSRYAREFVEWAADWRSALDR